MKIKLLDKMLIDMSANMGKSHDSVSFVRRQNRINTIVLNAQPGAILIPYGYAIAENYNLYVSCKTILNSAVFSDINGPNRLLDMDHYQLIDFDIILNDPLPINPVIDHYEFSIEQIERQDVIPVNKFEAGDMLEIGCDQEVYDDQKHINQLVAQALIANGWAEFVEE